MNLTVTMEVISPTIPVFSPQLDHPSYLNCLFPNDLILPLNLPFSAYPAVI